MKNQLLKIIGITIIILGFIVFVALLIFKNISEWIFLLCFISSITVGFLLYKIDEIVEFKTKWVKLKIIKKEIYAKAEEVKKISEELNKEKKELRKAIKVFIESFYLTLQTRNVFPIPSRIIKEIDDRLNILANFSVENKVERDRWINEVQNLLRK